MEQETVRTQDGDDDGEMTMMLPPPTGSEKDGYKIHCSQGDERGLDGDHLSHGWFNFFDE